MASKEDQKNAHKSCRAVVDPVTKQPKLIYSGWTESTKRKAKFLDKKPEELTDRELKTPLKTLKADAEAAKKK